MSIRLFTQRRLSPPSVASKRSEAACAASGIAVSRASPPPAARWPGRRTRRCVIAPLSERHPYWMNGDGIVPPRLPCLDSVRRGALNGGLLPHKSYSAMASHWFVRGGGKVYGPVDDAQLRRVVAERKKDTATEVAMQASGPWHPARQVRDVATGGSRRAPTTLRFDPRTDRQT